MIPRRRCRCKRRNGKILRRGVIPTKKNGPFPYNGRKNGVPCILVHKRQGRRELYGDRSHKRGPESAAGDEGGAGPPRGPERPPGAGAVHRRGAAEKTGAGPGGRDVHGQLRHRADPAGPAADAAAGREPAGAERASAGTAVCWCATCRLRPGGSWMPPASAGW